MNRYICKCLTLLRSVLAKFLQFFSEIKGELILKEASDNGSLYLFENNVDCFPAHLIV